MVHVTKADGSLQTFDREKVKRTARNLGVPTECLERLADEVESRLYEGIETHRVMRMVHARARVYRPATAYRTNLRRAIAILRPKPDFERFVQLLLKETGYGVEPGRILHGRCGEHEVDAIARKDGTVYFIEVKHHYNHHRMTGLDEGRIARAIVEDVQAGYHEGKNSFTIDRAMIICNTKLSAHAKRYASCWGIRHIGWDNPRHQNLRTMIEETKLYPVTILRGMNQSTRTRITQAGIITVKQLVARTPRQISQKAGISLREAEDIWEKGSRLMD